GSLSASLDESTWVLTSYLVANAIVLPSTGWLARTFGRKRFLVVCIGIFTLASAWCGAATSLATLVVARVLQGAGGGALQPIAQAVMLESFPPRQRGAAMAVYGMGVVVAPIIGPTLGGWITDTYSWRWSFYINLPVGVLAILMARTFVEDPPYVSQAKRTRIDYIGFAMMAIGLGTLQVILDKGQQEDWFASSWIRSMAMISVVSLVAFIVWELWVKEPIVDLRVLRNRNFAIGTAMITFLGVVLYGTTALLPLFLQSLMDYPALQSGLAVSPRGIGSLISMIVVGRLVGSVDNRWLLAGGFALLGYSVYRFAEINLQIAMTSIVWPNIMIGFALGFIFVPLTTLAMGRLRNEQVGNATGLYNLMRNLGGGFGIATVTTLLARGSQAYQTVLAYHTNAYNPEFQTRYQQIVTALTPKVGAAAARQKAYGLIYGEVTRQAGLLAYVHDFEVLAVVCLLCVPAVFAFQRITHKHEMAAH
ncbi:MAG: DHA2 family efflux MFS transporter permease subunit, partial [Bacillota bacterium]